MEIIELPLQERIKLGGRSHMAVIDYTDLNTTDGTAKTLVLGTYAARDIIERFIYDLVTPFDGGATSALALKVGYNGAAVDDDDAFIPSTEIHADATEILASNGTPAAVDTALIDEAYSTSESTVIASLRTTVNALRAAAGLAAVEAGTIEAVLTATGGDLDLLTTGKIRIAFNWIRLPDMRGINNT
jgi:hypothetical protein